MSNFRRALTVNFAIIGTLILVFGAAFYWFTGDLAAQAGQIVSDRALIAKRAATIGILADLKKESAAAGAYQQAIDKILVSQDQLLTFPNWLDGLARARQVTYTFAFQGNQTPPSGNTPGYIGFSVNASGALDDLTSFIKDIEFQSPRFLTSIDGFSLNGDGSSYNISFNGRVFFK